jgi:hypothetical protein
VALDRRDHRLGEEPTGRAHRTVAVDRDAVDARAAVLGHRLEVGPGAERAARAREHRGGERVVGLETFAGLDERVGGGAVHRVAGLGAVEGDDRDGAVDLVVHGHPVSSQQAQ